MDDDMDYFVEVEQDECHKPSEIDLDYEFDAARFFDFSHSETIFEIIEAELWFHASGNYPPSPLIIKTNWGSGTSSEQKTAGTSSDSSMSQETPESKSKSAPKLSKHRISTLMKPTASHLAKLNHAQKVYSTHIGERSLKAANKSDEQSLQSSSGFDNLATKRQKLETGYLCKVSHLKHQAQMLHKLSKKQGGFPVSNNLVNYKLKVTVPKQPELKTLHRAQIRRSKSDLQSSEHEKQKTNTLKAVPLNKKIPEACLKPQPKKSKQKLPNFREFHLKTMERATIHSPDNLSSHHTANSVVQSTATYPRRPKAPSPMKPEKSERSPQTNSGLSNRKLSYGEHHAHAVCQNTREGTTLHRQSQSSNNLRLLQHPPTELFNKMSLVPDTDTAAAAISQPKLRLSGKGMKENAPDPSRNGSSVSKQYQQFQDSFLLKKSNYFLYCYSQMQKYGGKPNHSGIGRTTSKIVCHPSVNRKLGIR
ncbi:protein TPX2-like isoform X3 [Ipomoea triloba]|uniref:protein TPX2-like isoform X3 n=1 Tax=Ipomoea triloba TaxID=35885 RepID=UPI00125DF5A9|nr:protein TPX2-like isoform X3 [Ipomoea triloba]